MGLNELTEELQNLKNRLELLISTGADLTDEKIVELSEKIDKLINEINRLTDGHF